MDIRLKRAYEPAAPADGYRILIDRLWPRGFSRHQARLLTLVYSAHDTEHNDAVVLAEVLRRGLPKGSTLDQRRGRRGSRA
jgi:uncharacterized protein YeaO (DUF488 family)